MASAPGEASRDDGKPDIPARDRLIVALDLATVEEARALVGALGDHVGFYKIGMQLQFAPGGLDFARELVDRGKKVFLDAKLFDIGATVERAVANVARMGVQFLTVHGNAPTIRAAVQGRGGSPLKLLSVTVLTSLDAADLADLGFRDVGVRDLVLHRAGKALEAGADGVVASGEEAEAIARLSPGRLTIVTPGIRSADDARGDQKRVVTAGQAIAAGADYLVIGRPISRAEDPAGKAQLFAREIEEALARRR